MVNRVRIDKWLWAARFFKTRALASKACELGRVEANGGPVKPAREVIYRHGLVVRITHWINLLCVSLLLMSGLQILNAHPRLYFGAKGADADAPWLEMGAANPGAARTGQKRCQPLEIRGSIRAILDRAIKIAESGGPAFRGFLRQGAIGKGFEHDDVIRFGCFELLPHFAVTRAVLRMLFDQLSVGLEDGEQGGCGILAIGRGVEMNEIG